MTFIPDSSALCSQVDPDVFFAEKGRSDHVMAAKALCAQCPLLAPCREYALGIKDLHGVWGGTSPMERRRIQKALKLETEPLLMPESHRVSCGTESGYKGHQRRGETCAVCSEAYTIGQRHRALMRRRKVA